MKRGHRGRMFAGSVANLTTTFRDRYNRVIRNQLVQFLSGQLTSGCVFQMCVTFFVPSVVRHRATRNERR
jgi:hypothetical protein